MRQGTLGNHRLKCNQLQPRVSTMTYKLLKMAARDGPEPPPPAFSGPRADSLKWFRINGSCLFQKAGESVALGSLGPFWAHFGARMFAYCSQLWKCAGNGAVHSSNPSRGAKFLFSLLLVRSPSRLLWLPCSIIVGGRIVRAVLRGVCCFSMWRV
jgi:hypothetical protein